MTSSASGKVLLSDLKNHWKAILEIQPLPPEIDYRLRKMVHRMQPLFDKMYIKTAKARETILQCLDKTETLEKQLKSGDKKIYRCMTDIEKVFEELLQKTYAFRIKAG